MAASALLIRGGVLVTMDPTQEVRVGNLLVVGERIAAVGLIDPHQVPADTEVEVIDAQGCLVMPGLVQAHVHLCQTLCRGQAEDLPLLAWLRERVWPYEAALSEEAAATAARLGCAELLLSGTTAILDMGTVHHEDALIEAVAATGIRATLGKAMMDLRGEAPAGLSETTHDSLSASDALCRRWHGARDGRIRYAYAPRFVLSCTDELLREVAERVAAGGPGGPRVHTHASEQLAEIALVRERFSRDNVAALARLGIAGDRAILAHCVHVDPAERHTLSSWGTHVAHCPSSNLKLGSGLAPVAEMLALGINVALGADGAPCNNRLDGFEELRLCSLLQRGRLGPTAITAQQALTCATLGGARALGLERDIGSLTAGKRADVVVLDRRGLHFAPEYDPAAALCHGARGGDVRDVLVDGRVLVRGGKLTELTGLDADALREDAQKHGALTLKKAGLLG